MLDLIAGAAVFALVVGILLSPLLSIIALVRSRHARRLEDRLDALEEQFRLLRKQVLLDRRAQETASGIATAERQGLDAVPSEALVPKHVSPTGPTCPQCSRTWDEKRCHFCGYQLEPAQPLPSVPALPEERERQPAKPLAPRETPPPASAPPRVPWHTLLAESEAWESVIGASWFNKIGVLVLVIGIALFIGYSLTHLGPAGRLAIGFATSASLLGFGVALERRPLYRIFARGLAAGGWAGLYFTTYAMHGLDAARVIDDPTLALLLLITVAAGMITHSLYFRSDVVTGLAYSCGYVAIAISPASLFSSVAVVVLAGTLLVVAYRFSWDALAVVGIVCTYGTFVLRGAEFFGGGRIWLDFTKGHVVTAICWLLFEMFDIAMVARARQGVDVGRTLLPLNACGLLGISLLHWGPYHGTFYILFGGIAIAYLLSAAIRAIARPVSSFDSRTDAWKRVVLGGYEAAMTLGTAFFALALWHRYGNTGWRLDVAWLVEAELLFLAGIFIGQSYLRALASAVFTLTLIRFVAFDLLDGGELLTPTWELMRWTPVALLAATVLYFNRAQFRPATEPDLLVLEAGYSFVATALVTLVLGFEMGWRHNDLRPEYLGISWLVLALGLMEVALRRHLAEFLVQSYLVGLMAIATLFGMNGFLLYPGVLPDETQRLWIWLLPAAACLYITSVRFDRLLPSSPDWVDSWTTPRFLLAAASGMSLLLLWHALPVPLVAVGWGLFAWLMVQLGFQRARLDVRWHGYVASGLMLGRLFLANFTNPGMTAGISHRLLTVAPIVLFCYYLAGRLAQLPGQDLSAKTERTLGRWYLYAAAVVAFVLMRFELGRVLAVVGWALFGTVLLYVGVRQKNVDLRWQSYLLALVTFSRSWATNFNIPEGESGVFGRVVTGALVVGSLYLSQLLSPRHETGAAILWDGTSRNWLAWLDAYARSLFCTLATVLLGVLLFYEVPIRVLTAAWGIEGTVLLLVGFILRDRVFRLAGLTVLTLCLPKIFLYDLAQLETPYRIFSFVLLGLLLIAVSWVYTRFRAQVRAYF